MSVYVELFAPAIGLLIPTPVYHWYIQVLQEELPVKVIGCPVQPGLGLIVNEGAGGVDKAIMENRPEVELQL